MIVCQKQKLEMLPYFSLKRLNESSINGYKNHLKIDETKFL